MRSINGLHGFHFANTAKGWQRFTLTDVVVDLAAFKQAAALPEACNYLADRMTEDGLFYFEDKAIRFANAPHACGIPLQKVRSHLRCPILHLLGAP
jgi:hypothetical protein